MTLHCYPPCNNRYCYLIFKSNISNVFLVLFITRYDAVLVSFLFECFTLPIIKTQAYRFLFMSLDFSNSLKMCFRFELVLLLFVKIKKILKLGKYLHLFYWIKTQQAIFLKTVSKSFSLINNNTLVTLVLA